MSSAIADLLDVLQEVDAVPRFRASRLPVSTLYDPGYRALVLALTIKHGGRKGGLNARKLKLFQFVVIRPTTLSLLEEWVRKAHSRNQRSLLEWGAFPRGYAADTLHERVLAYLVATGDLTRDGVQIRLSETSHYLMPLLDKIDTEQRFRTEVETVKALVKLNLTDGMLA